MKKLYSILIVLSSIFLLTNLGFADGTPAMSVPRDEIQPLGVTITSPEGTTIYDDPSVFDGLITQNFSANVGLDANGDPLPPVPTYWDGRDIFSTGVDMDFSSPDAPDPTLVTVASSHPELGPVGPNGEFWCGALRFDFSFDVVAVGFGTHALGPVQIILLNRDGSQLSSTAWNAASGFVGIIDETGFASVILDTDNCFWSMDEVRGERAPHDLFGYIELKGSPLANRKVIVIQELKRKKTWTDANGCFGFRKIRSGKKFKLIIKGPVVPE